ncbi:MAG: hypothetical protein HCTETUND1_142 [Candidatus Hodgkinia cicadicola]|nr:MAG: hypothetical protein HCTETUND1_142 [Candidatus Hodgkinia cicadicola]
MDIMNMLFVSNFVKSLSLSFCFIDSRNIQARASRKVEQLASAAET